jgi:hypothetical protein
MNRNVLMWYGHVESMEEERVVKRVSMSKVEGSRGRSKLRWMNGMKGIVEWRGANIEYAKMCMQNRERWMREVHSKHTWLPESHYLLVSCVWTTIRMMGSHLGTRKSDCNRTR